MFVDFQHDYGISSNKNYLSTVTCHFYFVTQRHWLYAYLTARNKFKVLINMNTHLAPNLLSVISFICLSNSQLLGKVIAYSRLVSVGKLVTKTKTRNQKQCLLLGTAILAGSITEARSGWFAVIYNQRQHFSCRRQRRAMPLLCRFVSFCYEWTRWPLAASGARWS